jgi:hypothetical protein
MEVDNELDCLKTVWVESRKPYLSKNTLCNAKNGP